MRYKVTGKQIIFSPANAQDYQIQLDGSAWHWFSICEDDFNRITRGDTIEMLISVIQPDPIAA